MRKGSPWHPKALFLGSISGRLSTRRWHHSFLRKGEIGQENSGHGVQYFPVQCPEVWRSFEAIWHAQFLGARHVWETEGRRPASRQGSPDATRRTLDPRIFKPACESYKRCWLPSPSGSLNFGSMPMNEFWRLPISCSSMSCR